MAHSPETRRNVRGAYVFQRLSIEVAAATHGVPPATAKRWKREARAAGDDWDAVRAASAVQGDGYKTAVYALLQSYLVEHEAAVQALRQAREDGKADPVVAAKVLASLADSFHKTTAAAAKASPEVSELAIATDVLERLGTFIAEQRPDAAPTFLEVLPAFGEALAGVYG